MSTIYNKKYVVLRDERNPGDSRHLSAEIKQNGDLVIAGQDIGSGVEGIFGSSEYEWFLTIKSENRQKLADAFDEQGHILDLLQKNFSHEKAADLDGFLKKNDIAFEFWSRVGD